MRQIHIYVTLVMFGMPWGPLSAHANKTNWPALMLATNRIADASVLVEKTLNPFGHLKGIVSNTGYRLIDTVEEVRDAKLSRVVVSDVVRLLRATSSSLTHIRDHDNDRFVNASVTNGTPRSFGRDLLDGIVDH
jgi:NADP-dependent 3-hydroxy acid dehydrogenase YdfG